MPDTKATMSLLELISLMAVYALEMAQSEHAISNKKLAEMALQLNKTHKNKYGYELWDYEDVLDRPDLNELERTCLEIEEQIAGYGSLKEVGAPELGDSSHNDDIFSMINDAL